MMSDNSNLHAQDLIEGKIETVAFGGQGILRYKRFVIFIPFTAPGDIVRCRIQKVKKSFAIAQLETILVSSTHRIRPLCPYFGTCGGCQIQHLDDEAQMNYKVQAVGDALKRIGQINISQIIGIPAHLKWAYRRHITLQLRPFESAFLAGYIGEDNHSLIQIQTCPIFNQLDDHILSFLQALIKKLPNPRHQHGRLTLLKNQSDQIILFFQFHQELPLTESRWSVLLQDFPHLSGAIIHSPHQEWVLGNPYCDQEINGLFFRFSPKTFVQNHPEQSLKICRSICQLLSGQSRRILDLYCGFGMTSLLLAKEGHQVLGIEVNSEAIAFAKENAKRNQLEVQFEQGDVEDWLPRFHDSRFDLILVNPPRTGLSNAVIEGILSLKPKEMIYISCMPATLARDLAKICCIGYQVNECKVYDMFPQTAHVETCVYLKRSE